MNILLASRFKRLLASIIDGLIVMIVPSIIIIGSYFAFKKTPVFSTDIIVSLVYSIISLVTCILYFALFESSRYKATPGKKIFKLYVVTTEGKQLSFKKASARYIILSLPYIIFFLVDLYLKHYFSNPDLILVYTLVSTCASLIVMGINIIWIVPAFFTKKRQGIHELLTSTMVCREK